MQGALGDASGNPGRDRIEIGTGMFDSGSTPMTAASNNPVDIVGSGPATILQNTATTAFTLDGPDSTLTDLEVKLQIQNTTAVSLRGTAARIFVAGDTGRTAPAYGHGVDLFDGGTLRDSTVSLSFNESGVQTTGIYSIGAGTRSVQDLPLVLADNGFDTDSGAGVVNIRRVRTRGPRGVSALSGTTNIDNAVIELFAGTGQVGIEANTNRGATPSATVHASNVTIEGLGTGTGISAAAGGAGSQAASVTADSSIVRNVAHSLVRSGGTSATTADLAISYSFLDQSSVFETGSGTLAIGPGNVFSADPGFVDEAGGDYHLTSSAFVLDAGGPPTAGSPLDFDGNPRVTSGAGGCVPRRDMGAFEFQPPPRAPHADARVDPLSAPLGVASTFTALNSCDPDIGDHLTYSWRFDDGATAHGFSVQHRFRSRGTHHATLTARDSTGRTGTATTTVVVTAARRCVNFITGGSGPDAIAGTPFGDTILGLGGADVLRGRGRADCLTGGTGGDRLLGGPGSDVLLGQAGGDRLGGGGGKDKLDGGPGPDRLSGGAANDRLYGRAGTNTYLGGAGNDRIAAANGVAESVDCGAGTHDRAKVDPTDTTHGCESITVATP